VQADTEVILDHLPHASKESWVIPASIGSTSRILGVTVPALKRVRGILNSWKLKETTFGDH
jgi:hypothetical protein